MSSPPDKEIRINDIKLKGRIGNSQNEKEKKENKKQNMDNFSFFDVDEHKSQSTGTIVEYTTWLARPLFRWFSYTWTSNSHMFSHLNVRGLKQNGFCSRIK